MELVMFLFDRITALDVIGPYEVLSRLPGAKVRFVGKTPGMVRTDNQMLGLHADEAIADVTKADLLLVPGGWGTTDLEKDAEVLDWIRAVHATTTYTTSVCTGSQVLGAAGVLRGRAATSHWAWVDRLEKFGATPTRERVVTDGKVTTAAGVASGIDMGLELVAKIAGPEFGQAVQLGIEYDPKPPFDTGSVEKAPPMLVQMLKERMAPREQ